MTERSCIIIYHSKLTSLGQFWGDWGGGINESRGGRGNCGGQVYERGIFFKLNKWQNYV